MWLRCCGDEPWFEKRIVNSGLHRVVSCCNRLTPAVQCLVRMAQVAAVKAVEKQLSKFEAEMESDGAAQRGRIRALLATEQQRAEAAVASSLQLSNFSNLTPYILGGDQAARKSLPVASVRSAIPSSLTPRHTANMCTNGSSWRTCTTPLPTGCRLLRTAAGPADSCVHTVPAGCGAVA